MLQVADDSLSLTKLFNNIYKDHKQQENFYNLTEEAGVLFAQYFNSIEASILDLDEDGYSGYVGKKGIIGMLNKDSVSTLSAKLFFVNLTSCNDFPKTVHKRFICCYLPCVRVHTWHRPF